MNVIDKLQCIIGGYERGGTTIFGELLKNHPNFDGRFECGMLMWKSPAHFINSGDHWYVFHKSWFNENMIDAIQVCTTHNFNEACNSLHAYMGYGDEVKIFYKSPAYMKNLFRVLQRCNCPCLIVVRDPRGVYWSRCKKNEVHLGESGIISFCNRYNEYALGLKEGLDKFKNRILVVQYEEFCENPIDWGGRIFEFIGLSFDDSYVPNFQQEFHNYSVHGSKLDKSYCYEWCENLSTPQITNLLKLTNEFKEFCHDPR